MTEETKKKTFHEKHPTLTDEEIKQSFAEADASKEQYTETMEQIEQNLLGFRDILDPIIDPTTKKILAWMRRPVNIELAQFAKMYEGIDLKNPSKEDQSKAMDRQAELMADLITVPKHDAEWWKTNTSILFSKLFAARLEMFFGQLESNTANF